MKASTAHASSPFWTARQGLSYGALGIALAFVALPLYVLLPNYYAKEFGMSLTVLGAILLGARLFDAVIDPALGSWADRLFGRSVHAAWRMACIVAVILAFGFAALFFPPVRGNNLLVWATLALIVTYAAYSFVSVTHQSWGARLGGDAPFRARVAAWREAPGLIGVLLASTLPIVAGLPVMVSVFVALLALGLWALFHAPRPAQRDVATQTTQNIWQPWGNSRFRALMLIFILNGIASAVPATLVLFFVQDLLQAPKNLEGVFLGTYFIAGALAIPGWMQVVKRIGLAWGWLVSMLLSILVFIWAATLGAGDVWAYAAVCALSGIALGADLAFPSALLTGAIAAQGDHGQHEGAYYGWWNFATKLNMALAAGLALPLLDVFGYTPGARDPQALQALIIAYCVLPCALKLIASGALFIAAKGQKFS
ncbi:MFS transporter [Variovorax sp. PCZ-1]|nr:MFS transporter [Variovorax sp. PCZ-1]MBS7808646.1 MFS transporter [Variovorax sp. PCZ-1]